jgi:hypothetical protein
MMTVRTFLIVILISFLPLFISSAMALTMTPYYSFSEFYGQGGYVNAAPGVLTPSGGMSSEYDSEEAAGTSSVAGGQAWWTSGTGSVSIAPISAQGWGEVTSNPETGVISSRSGAHHTDTGGDKVSYYVQLPGTNLFQYTPFTWGNGSAFGYIRMLWEVGTDGALNFGDSVELSGGLNVEGVFDGEDDMTMRATIMLNQVDNAFWLDAAEYINYGGLEDIVLPDSAAMSNMLWFEDVSRHSDASDDVDINLSSLIDVSVGDFILMEAMLETTAALPNDGIGRAIWAEFGNTLQTSLSSDTFGATLIPYGTGGNNGNAPVPEPSTFLLLGGGLAGLAFYARRRRKE